MTFLTDDWVIAYEKLPKPSYCGTCYGKGVTEKDVPVIDYVNGGYIETRYEPCQECGGDG
jgi:DnaJ-class molecular chaperone